MKATPIIETKITGVTIDLSLRELKLLKALIGSTSMQEKVVLINSTLVTDDDQTTIDELKTINFYGVLSTIKTNKN